MTWDPSSLPNLVAWYKADDAASITSSGGAVSQWNDQSGNGLHLVQTGGGKPSTGVDTINGLNVIKFTSSQGLHVAHALASPLTILIVLKRNETGSGNKQPISNFNDAESIIFVDGTVWSLYAGSVTDSATSAADTSAHQLVGTFGSSASQGNLYLDGIQIITNQSPGTRGLGTIGVSADANSNNGFPGDIAEVVFMSSVIGSTDRALWDAYVAAKWVSSSTPISDTDTGTGADAGESVAAAASNPETGAGVDAGESIAAATSDAETGTSSDAATPSVAFADTETASGTDAGETLSVGATGTETGTASDGGESTAAGTSDTDTGSGTDAGESIAAAISEADTASALDAGEAIAITASDADTGSSADGGEATALGTSGSDTGSGLDTESLAASVTEADSASAVDTESLAGAANDNDPATAMDAGEGIVVFVTDADSGIATDDGLAAIAQSDADAATSSDSESVAAGLTDTDLATFLESEALDATLASTDSGTALDDGTVVVPSTAVFPFEATVGVSDPYGATLTVTQIESAQITTSDPYSATINVEGP